MRTDGWPADGRPPRGRHRASETDAPASLDLRPPDPVHPEHPHADHAHSNPVRHDPADPALARRDPADPALTRPDPADPALARPDPADPDPARPDPMRPAPAHVVASAEVPQTSRAPELLQRSSGGHAPPIFSAAELGPARARGGSDLTGPIEREYARHPNAARPATGFRRTPDGPHRNGAPSVSVVLSDRKAPPTTGIGPRQARLPRKNKLGRRALMRSRVWPAQPPRVRGPIRAFLMFLLFLMIMIGAVVLVAHFAETGW